MRLNKNLHLFYFEAMDQLVRSSPLESIRNLCSKYPNLPTSRLLVVGIEGTLKNKNRFEKLERQRQKESQKLRSYFWILGTVGSASPFIGLFGTVIGILKSFSEMAKTSSGGFSVVAQGISESLIATAAGIVVAVVAVVAYNAFQTFLNKILLTIKHHAEEFSELLEARDLHI
ncbi:MAG: MotA/TolQ/ExbB proton channel family protein [Deltaproteobacteria bacterium]|nr:MotA/TolQ/ExbB proton channel family protein [Deltaproteobacteria bacterium]